MTECNKCEFSDGDHGCKYTPDLSLYRMYRAIDAINPLDHISIDPADAILGLKHVIECKTESEDKE